LTSAQRERWGVSGDRVTTSEMAAPARHDVYAMPAALERTTAITVAAALRFPPLQRGLPEVLAGHERLDRPIRWVHAGEVPNIASLLVGGELLLTTGMGLGSGEDARRRFVTALAERDVAALVIELGTSLPAVSAGMRDAAAAAQLPLVVLHREVAFVRVTEAIQSELLNRRYGLLREGDEVKDRLIAQMLGGAGVPELLATLSTIVGNPVYLESSAGQLLFHAGHEDDLDAWERVRRGDGRADGRAGVALEQTFTMGSGGSGRLVVLPTRRRPSELDVVALRHAAGIVALALLRAREDELVVRERGNLLADLAAGAVSGAQAARRAQRMGFPSGAGELLALAIDEAPASTGPHRAAVLGELQRLLNGDATPVLCGQSREGPLLMLAARPERVDDARAWRQATAECVADVVAEIWGRRRPGARYVLGIDGPVDWSGAGHALRTAVATAAAGAFLPERGWHDGGELGLERMLWSMRTSDELQEFVERSLGPLLAHDRERKLALMPTLEALCAHGGRKAEAARALHLHRQALYHRIARIEALLGVDLSDPGRLTSLHVAQRALPFIRRR
jgi:purine catabolism regulator